MPRTTAYRIASGYETSGAIMPDRSAHRTADSIDSYVGMILQADGGRVDLVVSAIRDDNTGNHLLVLDHGTSVEIRTAVTLRVTARTLQWHLGRHFGTCDLQRIILSARGLVTVDTESLAVASYGPS